MNFNDSRSIIYSETKTVVIHFYYVINTKIVCYSFPSQAVNGVKLKKLQGNTF